MKKSTIIIAGLFTIATIMTSCKSSSEATKEKTERSGQKIVSKFGRSPPLF